MIADVPADTLIVQTHISIALPHLVIAKMGQPFAIHSIELIDSLNFHNAVKGNCLESEVSSWGTPV